MQSSKAKAVRSHEPIGRRASKHRNLVVSPSVKFAGSEFFQPQRRVVGAPAVVDGEVHEDTDFLQEIIGRARRVGPLGDHAAHVLAAHLCDQPMADLFVEHEALNDAAVVDLRRGPQAPEFRTDEIFCDQSIKGAWVASSFSTTSLAATLSEWSAA